MDFAPDFSVEEIELPSSHQSLEKCQDKRCQAFYDAGLRLAKLAQADIEHAENFALLSLTSAQISFYARLKTMYQRPGDTCQPEATPETMPVIILGKVYLAEVSRIAHGCYGPVRSDFEIDIDGSQDNKLKELAYLRVHVDQGRLLKIDASWPFKDSNAAD